MAEMGPITVVIPTKDRCELVRGKVQRLSALPVVSQIVVVADGCADETVPALRSLSIPNLEIVVHTVNMGTPSAKNSGLSRVKTGWVAFLDDDDLLPNDYLEVLQEVAISHGADVISAPWFLLGADDELGEFIAARRNEAIAAPAVTGRGGFTAQEFLRTPFIAQNALARTAVAREIGFDTRYRGNFWREETDFYVSAAEAGYCVGVTNRTFSYTVGRRSGGSHTRSALRYEYWVYRNNHAYLQKHRTFLTSIGSITSPWMAQFELARRRVPKLAAAAARKARNRLRR